MGDGARKFPMRLVSSRTSIKFRLRCWQPIRWMSLNGRLKADLNLGDELSEAAGLAIASFSLKGDHVFDGRVKG